MRGSGCIGGSWIAWEKPTGPTGSALLWTRRVWPLPGGQRTGPNPTDKGKAGSKRHVVVDRGGIPLSVIHSAANVHDSKDLEEVVDATSPIRKPSRGRARKRPKRRAACRQGLRLPSMPPGFEEGGHNPTYRPARHRLQREAGAIQVGSGKNSVVGEPLQAAEGTLRAPRRHP